MLNMIAGLEPFEQGSIEVDGKPVTGPGSDRVVVFQDHALFPWLTVLDNVAFGLKQKGIGQKERQERAKEQILLPLDEQTRDVHPAGYDQEGVCCPGSQTRDASDSVLHHVEQAVTRVLADELEKVMKEEVGDEYSIKKNFVSHSAADSMGSGI